MVRKKFLTGMDAFHYLDFKVTFYVFRVLTEAHIHDEYQDALHLNVLKKYSAYEKAEVVCCGCFSWNFLIAKSSYPRTPQRCRPQGLQCPGWASCVKCRGLPNCSK